jgi:DNA-binding GntR family transcriptional regulator
MHRLPRKVRIMESMPLFEPTSDSSLDGKESQTTSLSQRAYDQIRRRIVDLELPPGSILDEGRLQTELSLGRTPIREALLRLSVERLVTIVPRRGIFVAEIGITDFQQIFEVRILLEAQAARLAARRGSRSHWERMEQLLAVIGQASSDDHILGLTIDENFHQMLYEAANNRLLQDYLTTLYALSRRMWRFMSVSPSDTQILLAELRSILIALEAGNADLAGELVETHIRTFQEYIQAAFLGAASPTHS